MSDRSEINQNHQRRRLNFSSFFSSSSELPSMSQVQSQLIIQIEFTMRCREMKHPVGRESREAVAKLKM